MGENRKFTRVEFKAPATMGNDESLWEIEVRDISLNGILITRPNTWRGDVDDEVDVDIPLDSNGDSCVVMHCRVAHADDEALGLERVRIGLNSVTHLRRMLELNLGSPAMVDREFANLREF